MRKKDRDAHRRRVKAAGIRALKGWLLLLPFVVLLGLPRIALAQTASDCPLPTTYRVQPGDSLSLIAERFHTDVSTLVALNDLADPDHIEVGQVLRLPCPLRLEDRVRATSLAGMAAGVGIPAVDAPHPHLALWRARAATFAQWQETGVPARLDWRPATVVQGDTVVVRLRLRAEDAITAAVRIVDTWQPMVEDTTGLLAFVPLHGLVQPGMLYITLGVRVGQGVTHTLELPVWVEDAGFPSQEIVLPQSKAGLLAPEVLAREAAHLGEVWARASGPPRWHGPFSWPVDISRWPTTAPYGVRRTYNGGAATGYHAGQDIAAAEGTPVYAAARGVVLLAEPLQVRGNAVVIGHGAGVTTNYWHLSKIAVSEGQEVERGDVIGYVGTTGLSTGAHLHWEIRVYGIPVNPVPWTRSPGPATGWRK